MTNDEMAPGALVTPQWLEDNRSERDICLVEIAGMQQDNMQAYKAGHVPGAVCWKWKEALWDERMRDFPSPEDFARRMGAAGISNGTIVVFYGEGIQFGIYAWWTLKYCGHPDVRVLDGGRYRWQAEGRPLVTDEPPARAPVDYQPVARHEEMRILRKGVLQAVENESHLIVDARSPEEYSGERVQPYEGGADHGAVRYGRIPGARHLYFETILDETKSFLPEAELRKAADGIGLADDVPVITYCRMSHRATVIYFALTEILGRSDVKIYDGSWTEWGNLVGVPIEL
jgi:thiosulfate/3-mercaptopyruvate sulfurtransferase